MATPTAKKRKQLTPADVKKLSLEKSVKQLALEVTLYPSLKDFADSAEKDATGEMMLGLLGSTQMEDVSAVNRFVVHPYFAHHTVNRDEAGRITNITDSDGFRLSGPSLLKALFLVHCVNAGYKHVVVKPNGETWSALMIPTGVNLGPGPEKKDRPWEVSLYAYFEKVRLHVTIEKQTIQRFATLPYMRLGIIKDVLLKANKASKMAALDLDLDKIKDLDSLTKTDQEDSKLRDRQGVIEQLIASSVASARFRDKVDAFKIRPSINLARTLKLLKPYDGKLYEMGNCLPVARVPLEDLSLDEEVLLSNKVIDQAYYASITSKPGKLLVYVRDDNVGVLKGRVWEPIKMMRSELATEVSEVMEAICRSNAQKGPVSKKPDSMDDDEEEEFNEIEF